LNTETCHVQVILILRESEFPPFLGYVMAYYSLNKVDLVNPVTF